jgi:adenylate kinase
MYANSIADPVAFWGEHGKRIDWIKPFVQLSTGDLLRAAVAAGTSAGKMAKTVMGAGGLVTDEIVIAILRDRLAEPDCENGVTLDGFPRTIVQAEALKNLLKGTGQEIDLAISLAVDDTAIAVKVTTTRSRHQNLRAPAINVAVGT